MWGRMRDDSPEKRRPAKRLVVLVLTVFLAGLGFYGWFIGMSWRVYGVLGMGWLWGRYTVPWGVAGLGGGGGFSDDDPRNLSPKVYLPVLRWCCWRW